MPTYSYTAKTLQNKAVKDEVFAPDVAALKKSLKERGLIVTKYSEVAVNDTSIKLKANAVSDFARQMGSMLDSGVTVVRALSILKERDVKPKVKALYEKLHKAVQNGNVLSEALSSLGSAFPKLFIHMVAASEESGKSAQVLGIMAEHYEKEHRLNSKIKSAMMYPKILVTITVLVVIGIFVFILPEFFDAFEEGSIPGITLFMMGVSDFLTKQWHVGIVSAIIAFLGMKIIVKIPRVNYEIDKIKLGLPVIGKLMKIIYTARFSRTLSSLYSSGVNMIQALKTSSTIIGNMYIEKQFDKVIKDVSNGEVLSEAVGTVDGFDTKLTTSILIGEESGKLDAMLHATAESFDHEADEATAQLVTLLEPIMIVVMAVVIGAVMISVFMPLMAMYDSIGAG